MNRGGRALIVESIRAARRPAGRRRHRRRGVRQRRGAHRRRPAPRHRRLPPSAAASAAAASPAAPRPAALERRRSSRSRSTTRTSTPPRTAPTRRPTELGGTVTQVGPSTATEAEQAPFIQDATTQGVSAIAISANDPDAVAPALKAAKAAGIKVVGYDSSPAVGAYDVFVNQTDFSLIGQSMADWACDLAPSCTGEIAILSAAATATEPERLDRRHEDASWPATSTRASSSSTPSTATTTRRRARPRRRASCRRTRTSRSSSPRRPSASWRPPRSSARPASRPTSRSPASASRSRWRRSSRTAPSPEFGLWSVPDLGYLTYYVADAAREGHDHRASRARRSRSRTSTTASRTRSARTARHPRPALDVQQGQHRRLQTSSPA